MGKENPLGQYGSRHRSFFPRIDGPADDRGVRSVLRFGAVCVPVEGVLPDFDERPESLVGVFFSWDFAVYPNAACRLGRFLPVGRIGAWSFYRPSAVPVFSGEDESYGSSSVVRRFARSGSGFLCLSVIFPAHPGQFYLGDRFFRVAPRGVGRAVSDDYHKAFGAASLYRKVSKRRTIEALFDEYKFRYSGIYLWTLFQGRISTAGILGIFAVGRGTS